MMFDAALAFMAVSFVTLGYLYAKVRRLEDRLAALYIPQNCAHHHVENQGTFGAPEFVCKDCGAMVSEP